MSGKLVLAFQVSDMCVMKDTLKRLGHKYTETATGLQIDRPYYPIQITKEQISCDSMNRNEIDVIKYEYQKDFQLHERAVRGESFEVTETKDEIVILVH